jgi:hypothetical protein
MIIYPELMVRACAIPALGVRDGENLLRPWLTDDIVIQIFDELFGNHLALNHIPDTVMHSPVLD